MKIKYMERDSSIKEADVDKNNPIKFAPGGIVCWIYELDQYGQYTGGNPKEKFFPFSSLVEIKEIWQ